jgi:hypothetical protein
MERRLRGGGMKWVKTRINSNFSVEIEPKKIRIKIEEGGRDLK